MNSLPYHSLPCIYVDNSRWQMYLQCVQCSQVEVGIVGAVMKKAMITNCLVCEKSTVEFQAALQSVGAEELEGYYKSYQKSGSDIKGDSDRCNTEQGEDDL